MQIRNANSLTLEIAATGERVEPGATVEVDDELGLSLLEQPANWDKPKSTTTKKESDR